MTNAAAKTLILTAFAAASALTAAAEQASITVRLYDYAGVEDKVLEAARRQAAVILTQAGVRTRWEQCRTSSAGANRSASCAQHAGEAVIQLRIHPREMAKKIAGKGMEFGYSLPSQDGFGIIAGVYADRTRDLAKQLGASLPLILGHTMAHEIGHLLLGSNSHAKAGIMRPTWGDRDLRLAHTGAFGFTQSQSKRMQRKVSERAALQLDGDLQRAAGSSDDAERALAQLFEPAGTNSFPIPRP